MPEKEPKQKIIASEGDGLKSDLPPPKEVTEKRSKLKTKWKRFAKAHVKGYDLGDAAKFAGYECKDNAQLRHRGWQLLRRPEVQEEIRRLEDLADKETVEGDMVPDANEVTMHAAEIMRDQKADAKDRLQAANLIAKLHGYHAPVKQQHESHTTHDLKFQFVRGGEGGEKQITDVTAEARQIEENNTAGTEDSETEETEESESEQPEPEESNPFDVGE